ncbi:unnamed protein product [Choristocarpus tenellus]
MFIGGGGALADRLGVEGREGAFTRLARHLDSFATLREHLVRKDLWSLKELWQACENEALKTSGKR